MRKRILLILVSIAMGLLACGIYVGVKAGPPLLRARSVLGGGDATGLGAHRIGSVLDDLYEGREGLDSIPARVLQLVPVVRQNLAAVRALVDGSIPTLQAAVRLNHAADHLASSGIFEKGRVNLEMVSRLEEPLEMQVKAVQRLNDLAARHQGGLLIPPIWEGAHSTELATRDLLERAHHAEALFARLPELLGGEGERRYLVLLINNAELRGSGGLLSGLGLLTSAEGKLELERLYSPLSLQTRPLQEVPVPETFERYSLYDANTTFWRNITFSPDFPDVATVARRLFAKGTGIDVHGVLGIDPRGLSALLPEDASVKIGGRNTRIRAAELPSYVYSDAYEAFDDQAQRREVLLSIGAPVFETVITEGLRSRADLERAGRAAQQGHIRVVVFEPEVDAALRGLDVAGQVPTPGADPLLVAAQNFGAGRGEGSKLDYWAERHVTHRCSIQERGAYPCETTVEIANETPAGLVRYVAGYPYGLLRDYVEIFVPAEAELEAASLDGEEVDVRVERHGHLRSVAVYVEIPRGQSETISIRYLQPARPTFRLEAIPQPLARTARLSYALRFPESWEVRGPGSVVDRTLRYAGPHDRVIEVHARPEKLPGLTALWSKLFGRSPSL